MSELYPPIGQSILASTEMGINYVNNRSDLLPGYRLKLDYADTQVTSLKPNWCFQKKVIFIAQMDVGKQKEECELNMVI